MSKVNFRPGITLGCYPQKQPDKLTDLEQKAARFFKHLKKRFTGKTYSQKYVTDQINQYQQALQLHELLKRL